MAECGTNVGNNTIAYPCTLDTGHAGPHRAMENPASVRDRNLWERDRPAWERLQEEKRIRKLTPEQQLAEREKAHLASGLGEFQGRAQTTAERYTENPTAHPGVTRESDIPPPPPEQTVVYVERDDGTSSFRPATAAEERVAAPRGAEGGPVGGPWGKPGQAPTKQREGDQVLPTVNDQPFIQDLVIADIEERKQVGIQRYGTPLQPFNDRNAFQDLYEELVDGSMYARQLMVERRQMALKVIGVIEGIEMEQPLLADDLREVAAWLGWGQ